MGHIVKGDISRGEVYYTNSTHLNNAAVVNPLSGPTRGTLPSLDRSGCPHSSLAGEARPSKSSLANFVIKTFQQTQNDQIAFSPEFTTCNACHRTSRGLQGSCRYCGSGDVTELRGSRVTLRRSQAGTKGSSGASESVSESGLLQRGRRACEGCEAPENSSRRMI